MKTVLAFLLIIMMSFNQISFATNPAMKNISNQIKEMASFPSTLKKKSISSDVTVYFYLNSKKQVEVLNIIGEDEKVKQHTHQFLEGNLLNVPDEMTNQVYFIHIVYNLIL